MSLQPVPEQPEQQELETPSSALPLALQLPPLNPQPEPEIPQPEPSENGPPNESDRNHPEELTVAKHFLEIIPEDVFIKIFETMPVDEMKKNRLVCTAWNNIIVENPELLQNRTTFFFDGRKDDNGIKCLAYFNTFETGCSLWNTIRVRSSSSRHISWIDLKRTQTITHFEFHNCSLHWSTVVKVLMEFECLQSLQDIQDMYCWDYAMFNEGISEDQSILATNEYPLFLDTGRLDHLSNLRRVKIHRSNIRDCTTYLKILELRCGSLESIEITTDCNFPQGRSIRMYNALGNLLIKNSRNLQSLRFPFRNIYSQYDFRLTEDQRPFRDFLAFIAQENWINRIELEVLTELHLSFPMIIMDHDEFEARLKPFIFKQRSLRKLKMSSVNLEPGKEEILLGLTGLTPLTNSTDNNQGNNPHSPTASGSVSGTVTDVNTGTGSSSASANRGIECSFDIYINDGRAIPELTNLLGVIASLSVQTWRISGTEVKNVLPLQPSDANSSLNSPTPTSMSDYVEGQGQGHGQTSVESQRQFIDFKSTKELQYFSKSHTFRNFNIDLLCLSFSKLTYLNLVDHNTRVEHRHSSEAVAAIEDEHFQIILKKLVLLRNLQIIANMTYLTDSGMTGIKLASCKRMNARNSYVRMDMDMEGVSIGNLKYLKSLVLRGVGIKVTDVSVHFAFGSMERLKKIHIFGSQQTTPATRTAFHEKFPNFKGYDLEI